MEEKLVSIIVPIYNVSLYLEKCIDSIMSQEYKKIEIILVDDGSTDDSLEICKRYAEKDSRIIICQQENRGNTSARKHGLKMANGEYIAFVDADDYIGKLYISEMMLDIQDADIIIANVKKVFSYGEFYVKNKILSGIYTCNDNYLIKNMFYYENSEEFGVLPYLVAKLYKREFIKKGMLNFDDDIQYAEDRAFMFWCMINAKKIVFINSCQYFYLIHQGSLCTSSDEQFFVKLTFFFQYVRKLFEKHKEKKYLLEQLDKYMIRSTIYGLNKKIGLFQSDLISQYYCPEEKLPNGKDVILYGAGNVGKDFYKQLIKNVNLNIVAWVDLNYERYKQENLNVVSVDTIEKINYNYIILAVLRENIAENIKETLKKYEVDESKIYWIKPKTLF